MKKMSEQKIQKSSICLAYNIMLNAEEFIRTHNTSVIRLGNEGYGEVYSFIVDNTYNDELWRKYATPNHIINQKIAVGAKSINNPNAHLVCLCLIWTAYCIENDRKLDKYFGALTPALKYFVTEQELEYLRCCCNMIESELECYRGNKKGYDPIEASNNWVWKELK